MKNNGGSKKGLFAPASNEVATLASAKGTRRSDKLAEWVAKCPKITLESYLKACFGRGPLPAAPWAQGDQPITTQDVVSILCALGWFEPAAADRPGACDVVTIFDKTVEVPAATIVDGEVVPAEKKLVSFCAPLDKAQVVKIARVTPANLTASDSGEAFYKALQVMGFSEGFCPPGEPASGDKEGTFNTIENILLCPGSTFDISARNFDPFSPALFHAFIRAWGTC